MAGERVLVVDDEVTILELLERLCLNAGYVVGLAANGSDAMGELRETAYDVCIVDLRLPDIGGLEVLREAKRLRPDTEVIILTAYGDRESAVQALRLGAYDYLEKPVADVQSITIAVGRALERQRLNRSNVRLLSDLQIAQRELDDRRHQQLQYIRYIGSAMAGALNRRDVAHVLLQAILESTGCDGAVVLLVQDAENEAAAFVACRRPLGLAARAALVGAAVEQLPEAQRSPCLAAPVTVLPSPTTESVEDTEWGHLEFGQLLVRDGPEGIAAIAKFAPGAFAEESLDYLGILVNQGSTALTNAKLYARATRLATRDGVTGLCNHRHLFERLEAEIARAERYGQELAVIMMDLDRANGLKAINDRLGHQAGDQVLRDVAGFLENSVRRSDIVARYGGDEFTIIAPQTGSAEAGQLAERLRLGLEQSRFTVEGQQVRVTVAVGVAVFRPGFGLNASAVVSQADRAMYNAKECGGNQIRMAPDESVS